MPPKNKYTNPKLRDEVKEDIKASDKGGAPGQWSARKAQFMASEYKKRGGDYNDDPKDKDDSQKNLSKWGEEDWQTKEGSGNAKKADGTQKRYLPKKAWEEMSEKEKEETDSKKQDESKEGKQFVANTGKARSARKKANDEADENAHKGKAQGKGKGGRQGGKSKKTEEGEEEHEKDEQEDEEEEEEKEEEKEEEESEQDEPKPERGSKRKADSTAPSSSSSTSKKSKPNKTMGSKHDPATPPAQQATTTRLPKKGQQVSWKAMPGWVKGTVLEIARKDGSTEGKKYKASKEDPTIVLRAESGKVCAHKAKSVYFD